MEMNKPLLELAQAGQSIWLDSLRRSVTRNGELKRLIEEDGLRGMTSNPSIFEKAMGSGTEYDAQIHSLLKTQDWDVKDLYEALAVQDIQDAADLFRPVFDRTQGLDGYVSLEVSPYLARDAKGTIAEAKRLWSMLSRQNVMIKVPATEECIPAIEELIAQGININITLLFSQDRYEQVAEAYLKGLERFSADESKANSKKLGQVASVASFFVSRIDTLTDTLIDDQLRNVTDERAREELRSLKGKVAIANAKLAYERYQRIFSSDRWHRLAARGARPQRLLWASTSVKNPAYPELLYVDGLIGPETVNTVPPATFAAFRERGKVVPTLTQDVEGAREVLRKLAAHRISLEQVTDMLTDKAIELFSEPFDKLLGTLERKRRALLGTKMNSFAYELPAELNPILSDRIKQWSEQGKVRRLWAEDATLWTSQKVEGEESKWLGWLHAVEDSLQQVQEAKAFAQEIKSAGIQDVVLLGMGGSSLAPLLFSDVFSDERGYPKLSVIDSTHPDQIRSVQERLKAKTTLFVVSSKSGSTLEPNILMKHFMAWLGAEGENASSHFVAITDPGSSLERFAKTEGFRRIFYGDPEIGGRYSALSAFGMEPAALMGLDTETFLRRAMMMVRSCSQFSPPKENPGVHLGLALGILANHGRNKVTFVASKELCSLELWLEQLLAESTGKNGKGIIPISAEPLSSVEAYGHDRVFVYLKYENASDHEQERKIEEKLIRLQNSGQPVFRILVRELENLGQEFFRWEIATAVIGSVLGINPFDQPDVEAAKVAARALMSEFEKTGRIGAEKNAEPQSAVLRMDGEGVARTLEHSMTELFRSLQIGDCFAILAYIPETEAAKKALQDIRILIRNHMRVATSVQFGPRYLHSTGQAFKGGPDQEVFLVMTNPSRRDLEIPGAKYGFEAVVRAQALGDLNILRERGRRAAHLELGENFEESLQQLHSIVRHALHGVQPLNNQINTEGLNREFSRDAVSGKGEAV